MTMSSKNATTVETGQMRTYRKVEAFEAEELEVTNCVNPEKTTRDYEWEPDRGNSNEKIRSTFGISTGTSGKKNISKMSASTEETFRRGCRLYCTYRKPLEYTNTHNGNIFWNILL